MVTGWSQPWTTPGYAQQWAVEKGYVAGDAGSEDPDIVTRAVEHEAISPIAPHIPPTKTNGGVSKAEFAAMVAKMQALEAGQEEEAALAVIPVQTAPSVQAGLYNGVTTPYYADGGVAATPAAFPLALPFIGALGFLSLGLFKRLLIRFGPLILKGLIGAAAFKEFMDLIGIGAPDEYEVKIRTGRKKRRYSIGANPRVGTLQKVSRHCQRLLKRHEKVIREFLPKKAPRYGIPPARMLSSAEKMLIKSGGG
ncbi:hypothetical protein ES705_33267 [subsurface metagenome]